jgi:hypothetical protein
MELDRPLTPDDCVAVPIGSIVEGDRIKAVRTYTGWMDTGPRTYPPRYLHQYVTNQRLRVLAEETKQTLHHFRQRLRTVAIGRARANGVDISPVHRILDGCGVPVYTPSIGMWVDINDNELMASLPDGTIIQAGTPDIWGLYNLHVKHRSEWRWLTGGHTYTEGGTIIELPDGGTEEWYSAEWVEADDQLIEDLKREVLRIGAEAKRSASWCGQYELALERLCIEVKDRDEALEEQEEEAPFEAAPLVANQWLEPPRGAFVVGDRITRRNRPHTNGGYGNYHEADLGVIGTITEMRSRDPERQDRWRVRWDTGRTSVIDGQCIMLAEQEFTQGVHVARAYNQRLAYSDDDTQYDHQAPQGDVGVVGTVHDVDDAVYVTWSNGHYNIYDKACLEIIRPAEEGTTTRALQVGDRVRMASDQYILSGGHNALHDRIAQRGNVGVITQLSGSIASVQWDHRDRGDARRIDLTCLEPEGATVLPQVGDRVRRNARQYSIREYTYTADWEGIADAGAEGEVIRVNDRGVEGVITVRWDVPPARGGARDRRIDRECVEVITEQPLNSNTPAREPQVGDQVRLTSRFAYGGSSQDSWDRRFGRVGDVGTVVSDRGARDGTIQVTWPNGDDPTYQSNVDRVCVEVVTPETEETPEPPGFSVGDRVRIPGNYWVTTPVGDPRLYNHLAPEGSVGRIERLQNFQGHDCAWVTWDHSMGRSRINVAALEYENQPQPNEEEAEEDRPLQPGDRVRVRPESNLTYNGQIINDQLNGDIHTHEGTVGHHHSATLVLVNWDNGPNLVYDTACLERVPAEPEQRIFQRGDRVRLARPYTIEGRTQNRTSGRAFTDIYPTGMFGVVNRIADRDGTVGVRWENFTPSRSDGFINSRVDAACLDLATSDDPPAVRLLQVGDRVRRLPGPYSITGMDYNPEWERYCAPGDIGEVTQYPSNGQRMSTILDDEGEQRVARVRWDNDSPDRQAREGRGRRIDVSCVERVQ